MAERRAARHLWLRGWRICARNWIGGGGELDLVGSRWRTLRVVEVRRRPTLAQAFASVSLNLFVTNNNSSARQSLGMVVVPVVHARKYTVMSSPHIGTHRTQWHTHDVQRAQRS